MCYAMNREALIEHFRLGLLKKLDKLATGSGMQIPVQFESTPGATDADLPDLFKAIDAHVMKLVERYEVMLLEEGGWTPEEANAFWRLGKVPA